MTLRLSISSVRSPLQMAMVLRVSSSLPIYIHYAHDRGEATPEMSPTGLQRTETIFCNRIGIALQRREDLPLPTSVVYSSELGHKHMLRTRSLSYFRLQTRFIPHPAPIGIMFLSNFLIGESSSRCTLCITCRSRRVHGQGVIYKDGYKMLRASMQGPDGDSSFFRHGLLERAHLIYCMLCPILHFLSSTSTPHFTSFTFLLLECLAIYHISEWRGCAVVISNG
jgi:hypothetical protein